MVGGIVGQGASAPATEASDAGRLRRDAPMRLMLVGDNAGLIGDLESLLASAGHDVDAPVDAQRKAGAHYDAVIAVVTAARLHEFALLTAVGASTPILVLNPTEEGDELDGVALTDADQRLAHPQLGALHALLSEALARRPERLAQGAA